MRLEVIIEFVLTYSWGILIAGIVISTMAALGLLDWGAVITPTCEAQVPFGCLEATVLNTSNIEMVVRSTSNDSIIIQSITLRGNPPCGAIRNVSVNGAPLPASMKPRDVARILVYCTTQWGKNDIAEIDVLVGLHDRNTSLRVQGVVGG